MPLKQQIRYQTVLQHLLFWLAFVAYETVSYGWEDTDELSFRIIPQFVTMVLPVTMLVTYFNLYVLIPMYYYRQKYINYALCLVALLFFGGLIMRCFTHEFVVPWERIHDPERYKKENKHFWIPVRILRVSLQLAPIVAITMVLKLMRNGYRQQKHLRELEKEKFAAEMGLLKAQINPHFFFNTLNSLYALTLKKSDQASKIVLRLSDLMHYMLYDASASKVLLKDEINHLENYINIEQMRFADRLDLSFQYSGDISGKMIAPLLLLPFVENAFKHGIAEDAGWITITLKVIDNRLFLKVENSYPKHIKKQTGGIGLNNVRRRLDLIYPGKYELQLNQSEEIFEADLKLNL